MQRRKKYRAIKPTGSRRFLMDVDPVDKQLSGYGSLWKDYMAIKSADLLKNMSPEQVITLGRNLGDVKLQDFLFKQREEEKPRSYSFDEKMSALISKAKASGININNTGDLASLLSVYTPDYNELSTYLPSKPLHGQNSEVIQGMAALAEAMGTSKEKFYQSYNGAVQNPYSNLSGIRYQIYGNRLDKSLAQNSSQLFQKILGLGKI